jgi:hypothetical protein
MDTTRHRLAPAWHYRIVVLALALALAPARAGTAGPATGYLRLDGNHLTGFKERGGSQCTGPIVIPILIISQPRQGAPTPAISEIVVTKDLDCASALFAEAFKTKKRIAKARLQVARPEAPAKHLEWELENVVISSYSTGSPERLTLRAGRIRKVDPAPTPR